jgi:PAS domain S-box-containing protein
VRVGGVSMENIKGKIRILLEADNLLGLDAEYKEAIIEILSDYYEVLMCQCEKIQYENIFLETINKKYEALFDSSPVIIVLVDDTWKIVKYNQAAIEAFGQINVEKHLGDLIDDSSRDAYNLHIEKLIELNENVSNYVEVTRNEILQFYKMVSIATQIIQETFYQCVFINLTQEKLNEKINIKGFTIKGINGC